MDIATLLRDARGNDQRIAAHARATRHAKMRAELAQAERAEAASAGSTAGAEPTVNSYPALTKAEIRARLDAAGIEYDSRLGVARLAELLPDGADH